jgi:hypothetical protein
MNIEEATEMLKRIYVTEFNTSSIYDNVPNVNLAIETLLTAYEKEKEKNKKAKDFIKENSHEFNCKRDDLIELEFDNNTNATDLIDILDGNW